MNIETRIRRIAAKKVKVIITGKTRCRDGFIVNGTNSYNSPCKTRHEALQCLLARIRCMPEFVWRIEPVKPNPKAGKATQSLWGKKLLAQSVNRPVAG